MNTFKLSKKQIAYAKFIFSELRNYQNEPEILRKINILEDMFRQEVNGTEHREHQDWNETVSAEIARSVKLRAGKAKP